MRVYLDTSVYDAAWLLEEREGKLVYPDFNRFVDAALECRHSIIICDFVETELLGKYPHLEGIWHDFIQKAGRKLLWVEVSHEVKLLAKSLVSESPKIHFPDSVHLATAMKFADAFVTYDLQLMDAASLKIAVINLRDLV